MQLVRKKPLFVLIVFLSKGVIVGGNGGGDGLIVGRDVHTSFPFPHDRFLSFVLKKRTGPLFTVCVWFDTERGRSSCNGYLKYIGLSFIRKLLLVLFGLRSQLPRFNRAFIHFPGIIHIEFGRLRVACKDSRYVRWPCLGNWSLPSTRIEAEKVEG